MPLSLCFLPRVLMLLFLVVWMTATVATAVEVIPGLNLWSNNVTCCPTLPLVGPTWMIEPLTTTTPISDASPESCSFFPALDRPMVVVFQPNGNINGWADHQACQPFQGAYQISPLESNNEEVNTNNLLDRRYRHAFRWNQWKTQPFSTCMSNAPFHNDQADDECDERDMDAFWSQLSSTVTTLVVTGHTNMELQNSRGETVVRLEAVPDSYSCQEASLLCDLNNNGPFDPLGISATALEDYLAFGHHHNNNNEGDNTDGLRGSSGSSHLFHVSTSGGLLLTVLILAGTVNLLC